MGLIAIARAALGIDDIAEGGSTELRTDRRGALWVTVTDAISATISGTVATKDAPFTGARTVDLSADTSFATPPRGVYVGTAGDLKVDMLDLDGTTLLSAKIIKVTDFQTLAFSNIKKIYSTANGTTASNLIVGA